MDYLRVIDNLDKEAKRLQKQLSIVRAEKHKQEAYLYSYMKRHNIPELTYGNKKVKLEKIAPKEKMPRKKKSEREEDAVRLFREIGIPDPRDFYGEFLKTQKNIA